MVELSGFRESSLGFRLQQACEKALKSWIHLMDWLEESGGDVSAFESTPDLTLFAVQS